MRKAIIMGNWKMNGSIDDLKNFVQKVQKSSNTQIEYGLCVPYTLLSTLKDETKGTLFRVGAQNMHFEDKGAFTGEISSDMLLDLGVDTVIIGHSERRAMFNESDEAVNLKLIKAISKGLMPILCVGETLEERQENKAKEICKNQLIKAFENIDSSDVEKIVIAYEPIWAIGTGKSASSKDAEEMASYIRSVVKDKYGLDISEKIRIQYGGSVKPSNVEEIMSMPNIDGALVGGASLKEDDFTYLINQGGLKCQ